MKIRFTILFCLLVLQSHSTHLTGGYFGLKHITDNQYEVSLRLFRDAEHGQSEFDTLLTIGLFHRNNALINTYTLHNPIISNLVHAGPYDCYAPLGNFQVALYKMIIKLDSQIVNDTSGVYFSYERCCRNYAVNNISSPASSGMTVYLEIDNINLSNSTPLIDSNLFIGACPKKPFRYPIGCSDLDGDSLQFSIVTPLNGNLDTNNPSTATPLPGPYKPITWQTNHSDSIQINGDPILSIDPDSGILFMTPSNSEFGFNIIGIEIAEFRACKILSKTHIEMEIYIHNFPQPPSGLIQPVDYKNQVTIFPNPAKETATILLNSTIKEPTMEWQITDLHGKTILRSSENIKAGAHEYLINTAHIENGVYFIHVSLGDENYNQKLIINKSF